MFSVALVSLTVLTSSCCGSPQYRASPPCCHGYGVIGSPYHYYGSPYHPVYHPPAVQTLYDRLGGEAAIKLAVDDFVARAAADPKVNFTRKGTPAEWKATPEAVAHLKKMLVEFIGSATGGPQKYTGKSMKAVHEGMKITPAEFAALAADLKATLDKLKVPQKEQDELMKIVGSTAGEIIEKKRN